MKRATFIIALIHIILFISHGESASMPEDIDTSTYPLTQILIREDAMAAFAKSEKEMLPYATIGAKSTIWPDYISSRTKNKDTLIIGSGCSYELGFLPTPEKVTAVEPDLCALGCGLSLRYIPETTKIIPLPLQALSATYDNFFEIALYRNFLVPSSEWETFFDKLNAVMKPVGEVYISFLLDDYTHFNYKNCISNIIKRYFEVIGFNEKTPTEYGYETILILSPLKVKAY